MSLRETLEKNANASLALIVIIGYGIQALASTWPDVSPSPEWVVLELGLGIIAFAFYREDKAYKKDPNVREAVVNVAVEELLDKFAEQLVKQTLAQEPPVQKSESAVATAIVPEVP